MRNSVDLTKISDYQLREVLKQILFTIQNSGGIQGPTGPMGPQGPSGADGNDGATGPAGTTDHLLLSNIGVRSHSTLDTFYNNVNDNLTITSYTSSPNNTVNTMAIKAIGATTDVDLVIGPKGNGAISAQVADGTTANGNKRGPSSIDFQVSRNNATQVASGSNSSVNGGIRNTASNSSSFVPGGTSNISSAVNASASGNTCTASGTASRAHGTGSVASGAHSDVFGSFGSSFSLIGRKVHSSSQMASIGDSQFSWFGFKNSTTNATPTLLTADAGTASALNQLILQNNNSIAFEGRIIAKQSGSTNTAHWKVEGTIVRGANAASTTLLGATVTAIHNTPAWTSPSFTADTTNGGLAITVTGVAATNIRWNAKISTVEIIYA